MRTLFNIRDCNITPHYQYLRSEHRKFPQHHANGASSTILCIPFANLRCPFHPVYVVQHDVLFWRDELLFCGLLNWDADRSVSFIGVDSSKTPPYFFRLFFMVL